MKKILILLVVVLSSCSSEDKCKDRKACDFFEEQMAIIELSFSDKDDVDLEKLNTAIVLLSKTTSIDSKSDGNFFGRFKPTKEDYDNWKKWYTENRSLLVWNNETNTIELKDK